MGAERYTSRPPAIVLCGFSWRRGDGAGFAVDGIEDELDEGASQALQGLAEELIAAEVKRLGIDIPRLD